MNPSFDDLKYVSKTLLVIWSVNKTSTGELHSNSISSHCCHLLSHTLNIILLTFLLLALHVVLQPTLESQLLDGLPGIVGALVPHLLVGPHLCPEHLIHDHLMTSGFVSCASHSFVCGSQLIVGV